MLVAAMEPKFVLKSSEDLPYMRTPLVTMVSSKVFLQR